MSGQPTEIPGREATRVRGWWASHKWLIARRFSQAFFLALFLIGPVTGYWIVKGTLASSLTLGILPLTDPFMALQALVAGHPLESTALLGAAIVLVVYALIGGRMYCSWVCPVNPVTDLAHRLRVRLGVPKGFALPRGTRYGILGGALVASLATGVLAWELVNPVTLLHRELVYGMFAVGGSLAWIVILAVFVFDLAGTQRGFCGRVCPVGAFYGLVGSYSLLRVRADNREACNDCMDCYAVCPEPHVISPALKGAKGEGPVVVSRDCTNCGRCIDVCSKEVFQFGTRFNNEPGGDSAPGATKAQAVREAA